MISSADTDEALEDGEEPLVDTELETLRAAGVIVPQTQRKRKQNRSTPRHILFAEDDADGNCIILLPLLCTDHRLKFNGALGASHQAAKNWVQWGLLS